MRTTHETTGLVAPTHPARRATLRPFLISVELSSSMPSCWWFRALGGREARAALTPEDVVEFDRQWRGVMARATEALDLTEVLATLDSWRRIAWLTSVHGHDGPGRRGIPLRWAHR